MTARLGYRIMNPGDSTGEVMIPQGSGSFEQPLSEQYRPPSDSIYVNGYVYDSKTGLGLIGAKVKFYNGTTGQVFADMVLTSTTADGRGWYELWTDHPTQMMVEYSADGYSTVTKGFWELYDVNGYLADIEMKRSFPIHIVLLVAAAAALYMRRKNKVGKLTTGDVFPIMLLVGGVIAFSLIKDVLEFLGLWKDKNEKELDNAENDPNSFWSPTYWQWIKPANANYSYAITNTTAYEWAGEIYNSFHWYNDCEECVIAVFKRCRTKANASYLCYIFGQRYGQDLLTFLRGGWWPQDRLSDGETNIINNYIKGLPNY